MTVLDHPLLHERLAGMSFYLFVFLYAWGAKTCEWQRIQPLPFQNIKYFLDTYTTLCLLACPDETNYCQPRKLCPSLAEMYLFPTGHHRRTSTPGKPAQSSFHILNSQFSNATLSSTPQPSHCLVYSLVMVLVSSLEALNELGALCQLRIVGGCDRPDQPSSEHRGGCT